MTTKLQTGRTYQTRIIENSTGRILATDVTKITAPLAAQQLRAWAMRWTRKNAHYDCRAEYTEVMS